MPTPDAIQFGALAALATSTGDTIVSAMGLSDESLEKYNYLGAYLDPTDFVGAGLVMAGLLYSVGAQGDELTYGVIIGALAGGAGAKVAGLVGSTIAGGKK